MFEMNNKIGNKAEIIQENNQFFYRLLSLSAQYDNDIRLK